MGGFLCAECGAPFDASNPNAKYCSPACRQRAHRKRNSPAVYEPAAPPAASVPEPASSATLPEAPPGESELGIAVHKELAQLGQLDTWEAQMALSAARKIASSSVGPGTTATLIREFKGLMFEIRQNAKAAGTDGRAAAPDQKSEMERIRERRSYKASSA